MARKKESWQDSGYVAQQLPPSEEERKQGMRLWITIAVAAAALVSGVILRYTVFADRFRPAPFNPPVSTPSPTASPGQPSS